MKEIVDRRQMLIASTVALASGCTREESSKPEQSTRKDVPLRVLWLGSESETEVVQRAWGAVSPQPLKFDVVAIDRADASMAKVALAERAAKQDVVVFPMLFMAEMHANEALVPVTDDELNSTDEKLGRVYPALRSGAAQFGGQVIATPLGGLLPAVVSVDEPDSFGSWKEYHQWVKDELNGKASEPLAQGWAGVMFLWRASTNVETSWLFDRDGMQPLIADENFVDALNQLRETFKLCGGKRMSPKEIWAELLEEKLKGCIGFEVSGSSESADLSVTDLPGQNQNRLLLDPFTPLAALSAGCRQSAASKEFVDWMSGGDGSDSLRQEVPRFSITRVPSMSSEQSQQAASSNYTRWFRQRLATPSTLAALRLLSADEYYKVLDETIGQCLEGKLNPDEALGLVAKQWNELTAKVGVEKQAAAWRRSQGMRS